MHFGTYLARGATAHRAGVLVALAGNLLVSVSLWFPMHRSVDVVAAYNRWVLGTAIALLITLLAGVALQRDVNREEVGDGVLRAAAFLVILYVFWGSYAFALVAD